MQKTSARQSRPAPCKQSPGVCPAYPNAWVLGVTATPCRLDGLGLKGSFETLAQGPSVEDLTLAGWLVPVRVWAPPKPSLDLSEVPIVAGDYP